MTDHGDAIEVRYTVLVAADDPKVVVLRPDLVSDARERKNAYFLRRTSGFFGPPWAAGEVPRFNEG